MSERRTRSPKPEEESSKRRRLVSLSPSPPAVFKGKEKAAVKLESSDEAEKEQEEDDDGDNCPICLQPHKQRAMVPTCSHEFCLECIVVWCDQSRRCPLCQGNIGDYLIYNIRSRHDYQKYFLTPLSSSSPKLVALTSTTPRRPRRRRPERRWGPMNEGEEEEDRLDRSMVKRRWVYRHKLFAKHVASNTYTKFRPFPTPQQFGGNADMVRRATAFVRRELTCVLGLMGQEQGDIEFLTSFTISIMKSLDIRSEGAIKLLAEFLDLEGGMERAEQFAHEVYCYIRSPYQDMFVYDSVVQYDVPPDATGAMPDRTEIPPAEGIPNPNPQALPLPPIQHDPIDRPYQRPSRSRSRSRERLSRRHHHRSHRQITPSHSRSPSRRRQETTSSSIHSRARRDELRSSPPRSPHHLRQKPSRREHDHYSPPRRNRNHQSRSASRSSARLWGNICGTEELSWDENDYPDEPILRRIVDSPEPSELREPIHAEPVCPPRAKPKPVRKRFTGIADTVSAHLSLGVVAKTARPRTFPPEMGKKTLEERLTSPTPETPIASTSANTPSASTPTGTIDTSDKRAELLQRLMRERRNRPASDPVQQTRVESDVARERHLRIRAKLEKEKKKALAGITSKSK